MPTLRDHLQAAEAAGKGGHRGGGHRGGGHRGGGRGRGGGVVFYDRAPGVVVVDRDCPPGFYYDEFGNCRPLPYHSQNVGRGKESGAVDDMLPKGPGYDMRRPTSDAAGELGDVLPERGAASSQNSTRTSTETTSPTSTETSTKAFTSDNVTVTGGAGDGNTSVTIYARAPADVGAIDDDDTGAIYDDGGGLLDEPKLIAIYDGGAGHFDARFRPLPPEASGGAAVPVGWFNPFDPIGSGAAFQTLRDRDALASEIMTTDARIASAQKAGAKIPNEVIFDYVAFRKDWDAVKSDDITNVQLSSMRARFRAQLDALAQYMKVDDLRPPSPITQTIPNAVNKFGESMQTVATAGAVTIVAALVVAAILLRPHMGSIVKSQASTGASLAKSLAK